MRGWVHKGWGGAGPRGGRGHDEREGVGPHGAGGGGATMSGRGRGHDEREGAGPQGAGWGGATGRGGATRSPAFKRPHYGADAASSSLLYKLFIFWGTGCLCSCALL